MAHTHSDSPWHFSYVWEHLDVGYVQGMCDLLAPLLVVLDNGEEGVLDWAWADPSWRKERGTAWSSWVGM